MALRLLRAGCVVVAILSASSAVARSQAPALDPIPFPELEPLEAAVADHLREARRSFEAAPRASSRDLADAYGALGRVFHAYEFFDAAEACYRNATQLRQNDATWLHLSAYLAQQTGRYEDSVTLYLAARRSSPNDHAATIHLGEAYLGLGRIADAREQFESQLERYPGAANAGLGEVALRQGRYREAVDYFETALTRMPSATSLHYSLGMAYRGLGRVDDARAHLQRRGAGGIRVADPIVDALQTLVRGERAFVMQGRRAYEARQFQAAADAFRKAAAAAPSSATPRVNLGLALAQLGDASGAGEQFEGALRLDPENREAHAGWGTVLARQGRDAEAIDHLRVAFRQLPSDTQIGGELVRALLKLSRKDEAIEVLTQVRNVDPDDESSLLSLSILLADRERYRDAVGLLDESYRRFPDRAPTATTLARLLASSPDLSVRNGQRAFDLAAAVYKAEPTPVHGETIALALSEIGRCDEASEWMRRAIAEADRLKDQKESARLRTEAGRYKQRPCRP
jgi:tetratricopeptide (TPR) repeat protein